MTASTQSSAARQILALVGRASRSLFPHLTVRPGGVRGRVQLSRYTNKGLAETSAFNVADLTELERQGRIKIHRGPVRRPWSLRNEEEHRVGRVVAFRQMLLVWHPRWIPGEEALRTAEVGAMPWRRLSD
jgi:hypothetical protein